MQEEELILPSYLGGRKWRRVSCHTWDQLVLMVRTGNRSLYLTFKSWEENMRRTVLQFLQTWVMYRVTRRVFSKSVTSKLHLLFEKNLAGYLKTLKGTRISAMYTNFLHLPVHSGPSKFSRSKISNWSLGNTKANKNLLND